MCGREIEKYIRIKAQNWVFVTFHVGAGGQVDSNVSCSFSEIESEIELQFNFRVDMGTSRSRNPRKRKRRTIIWWMEQSPCTQLNLLYRFERQALLWLGWPNVIFSSLTAFIIISYRLFLFYHLFNPWVISKLFPKEVPVKF